MHSAQFLDGHAIKFDLIQEYLTKNANDEKKLNLLSDTLLDITRHAFSNHSKKLFKMSAVITTEHHIVNLINIASDRKANGYLGWFAEKALVIIDSPKTIEHICSHKLFGDYLFPLYIKYKERQKVQDILFEKTDFKSLSILLSLLHKQEVRHRLCDWYKKELIAGIRNCSGSRVLEQTIAYYNEDDKVKELFELSKCNKDLYTRTLSESLLDGSYNEKNRLTLEIQSAAASKAISELDISLLWFILNSKKTNFDVDTMLKKAGGIETIICSLCEKLRSDFELHRTKQKSTFRKATPYGFADSSWQPYYMGLLCLQIIARQTNNAKSRLLIINTFDKLYESTVNKDDKYHMRKALKYVRDSSVKLPHFQAAHRLHSHAYEYDAYRKCADDILTSYAKQHPDPNVQKFAIHYTKHNGIF